MNEVQKIGTALRDCDQLEKFMRAVAAKVKCLPSYASPDPEDGNAHIIRALDDLHLALQGLAEALLSLRGAKGIHEAGCWCMFGHNGHHESLCAKAQASLEAAKPFLKAT